MLSAEEGKRYGSVINTVLPSAFSWDNCVAATVWSVAELPQINVFCAKNLLQIVQSQYLLISYIAHSFRCCLYVLPKDRVIHLALIQICTDECVYRLLFLTVSLRIQNR